MKVIAYTALHYGAAYLGYAIRSIIDQVDEYWVLYSAVGSHGHQTDRQCPDSREELVAIAQATAGSKLRWHDGTWAHEGLQRETIHELIPDADIIIVLDADEIWNLHYSPKIHMLPEVYEARYIRHPIIHYWRSFYKCVLHDPAFPIRIICPKMPEVHVTITHNAIHPINHMGYAQMPDIIEYKQHTHGHKNEWDWSWFHGKFLPNAQTLVHPVGSEHWNPETVDPFDYMPAFMREHPYADLEVIGDTQ